MPLATTTAAKNAYGTSVQVFGSSNYLTLVSGVDSVADACLVRLNTARLFVGFNADGTAQFSNDFGYDVTQLEGSARSSGTFIITQIQNQLEKDGRVATCSAVGSLVDGVLTVQVLVTLSGGETFNLIGTPVSNIPTSQLIFTVSQ